MKLDKFKKINFKNIGKADAFIGAVLVISILLLVNFLSYQVFYRWDLTEGNSYSISGASKVAVSDIQDIVNINVYFSGNLPSQLISLRQELADILNEYENYSNGKIKVKFIDPSEHEGMDEELNKIGIPLIPIQVYEKDKRELINAYLGMSIVYGDKVEIIPVIERDTSDLEYKITVAIKKAISNNIATLGFLTSNGTMSLDTELSAAKAAVGELYKVVEVDLSIEGKISADIDTLIIAGPKEVFEDDHLKEINEFLVRGGSLLCLIDGVLVSEGTAVANSNSLLGLLRQYGVAINSDLVADRRSGSAQYKKGFFTVSTPYAYWPKIGRDGFNSDVSMVSGLDEVVLPWVSSVSIEEGKLENGVYENLAYASDNSWLEKDNFNLNPEAVSVKNYEGSISMMTFVKSGLKNVYSTENEVINGKILVVGDSEFISDGFLSLSPSNLLLFQNLVDGLSLGGDLIDVRSKISINRPIDEDLSSTQKSSMRYLNVFGVTVLVLVLGLGRYYFRKKSRFVDEI